MNSPHTGDTTDPRKRSDTSDSTRLRSPKLTVAVWTARLCFTFVFVVNIQCAFGFVFSPEAYMGAYELAGVSGRVGIQGLGVAFLMWNCTYPLFIGRPERHRALGGIIIAQQVVGLVGESLIRFTLPKGHSLLSASIERFIAFDGAGLMIMVLSFVFLVITQRRSVDRLRENE